MNSTFRNTILSLATLMAMASCSSNSRPPASQLETGDLIFVSDTAGMGSAVMESTGQFSHVAVVERRNDGVYVWEATPSRGVIRSRLNRFLGAMDCDSTALMQQHGNGLLTLVRHPQGLDATRLTDLLYRRLGQSYDDYFMPNNGRCYCSELIEECFYNTNGEKIFHTLPMNFKAIDGTMPDYWTRWFDSLGVEIPQGMPGTNPSDLYREACPPSCG